MNVKNIDDFLHDIDERKTGEWILENDCHSKVKKVKMIVEWILTEREEVETLQITLEENRLYNARRSYSDINPEKHWVVPNQTVQAEYKLKDSETGALPQKVKIGLSQQLEEPIYDGRNYFKNGEKYRI